jgi:excisionase family DNA binding protein
MEEEKTLQAIPDILDLEDLAGLLRVTKPTAKKLVEEKVIPGFKFLKGKYLISKRQLIKVIEERS